MFAIAASAFWTIATGKQARHLMRDNKREVKMKS
jgi:hypothetical protein